MLYGELEFPAEAVARIDAVSRDDVRNYAGGLTGARAALALYGPVQAAPDLDVAFKDEADREAARNFMDLLAAAQPESGG